MLSCALGSGRPASQLRGGIWTGGVTSQEKHRCHATLYFGLVSPLRSTRLCSLDLDVLTWKVQWKFTLLHLATLILINRCFPEETHLLKGWRSTRDSDLEVCDHHLQLDLCLSDAVQVINIGCNQGRTLWYFSPHHKQDVLYLLGRTG